MNRIVRLMRLWGRMNWLLTAVILLLLTIGVVFIFSATTQREETSVRLLYQKQIWWAIAGLAMYFIVAALDYRRICDLAIWVYVLAIILLVAVLIVGTKIYGARRWLMFFGTGIQPSEFAKLAYIILIAGFLGRRGVRNDTYGIFWSVCGLAMVPVLLIVKEPDLGTAMIFVPITIVLLYVGGAPSRPLALITGIGGTVAVLLLVTMLFSTSIGFTEERQEQLLSFTGLSDYQRERIMVFLNPDRDPHGTGWNRLQSEIAIGGGGLTGRGYLKGMQNKLDFLPKTVAPTDFIFSVIAEETGFVGSAAVLGLFAVLLLCGCMSALAASDTVGRLLASGVMTMIFSHIMVNVSMTIGLMPITGVPLPLVSYGGTFVLAILVALGLVQSVYVRRGGGRDGYPG